MVANIRDSVFNVLADFIVSEPSLEAVVAYRMPDSLDARLHELLDKNREEGLLPEEREDLDKLLMASHLMTLAKAKARLKLEGNV